MRSDRNKPINVRLKNLLFAKDLNVTLNARRNYCDLKAIYNNFTVQTVNKPKFEIRNNITVMNHLKINSNGGSVLFPSA